MASYSLFEWHNVIPYATKIWKKWNGYRDRSVGKTTHMRVPEFRIRYSFPCGLKTFLRVENGWNTFPGDFILYSKRQRKSFPNEALQYKNLVISQNEVEFGVWVTVMVGFGLVILRNTNPKPHLKLGTSMTLDNICRIREVKMSTLLQREDVFFNPRERLH